VHFLYPLTSERMVRIMEHTVTVRVRVADGWPAMIRLGLYRHTVYIHIREVDFYLLLCSEIENYDMIHNPFTENGRHV
jgi:hypothetical protein